jgi:hypothetical protein
MDKSMCLQNETRGQEDSNLWGGVRCSAHFDQSISWKPAGKTPQTWCEKDTSNYLISNRLQQQLGFVGTPAQPKSAAAVVSPPPPPPPVAPPPPPINGPVIYSAVFANPVSSDSTLEAPQKGAASTPFQCLNLVFLALLMLQM